MANPLIRVINYDDTGTEIVREVIPLKDKDQYSIGRSQNADIKIMDIKVSRSHSRIERRSNKFYIVDLGSRNGTYVNGERVTTHELINGDNIKVGFSILRFEEPGARAEVEEPAPAAKAAPPPETVYTCHMCHVQVTEAELRTGKAEEIAGKVYCQACVKKTDELFRQALVEDSQDVEEEDLDIPEGGSLADMIEEDEDEADLDLLPDD